MLTPRSLGDWGAAPVTGTSKTMMRRHVNLHKR